MHSSGRGLDLDRPFGHEVEIVDAAAPDEKPPVLPVEDARGASLRDGLNRAIGESVASRHRAPMFAGYSRPPEWATIAGVLEGHSNSVHTGI